MLTKATEANYGNKVNVVCRMQSFDDMFKNVFMLLSTVVVKTTSYK
jgi:hypothetical protein